MEVISASFLKDVNDGKVTTGTVVSGVVLISNYSIALTKNNKEYMNGQVLSGVKCGFKVWSNAVAFSKMKSEEYSNTPTFIRGTVDNYNGSGSLFIEDVTAVSDFTPDQFLEQKYNVDAYYNALVNILKSSVSEKGMSIFNKIFDSSLVERFKVEFAASSHHDNCKGGLLAHTYKCVSLMNWVTSSYNGLISTPDNGSLIVNQDRKDLLMLGTALHDIGKVREMNFGVYQSCSKVTHRFLGIEMIEPYKNDIIESYDEDWYYDLVSILLQHHGEYGDPCKTLVSYIVNKVDLFESQMTYIPQLLSEKLSVSSSGCKINIDGDWLTV